jgi:hypothetical protein
MLANWKTAAAHASLAHTLLVLNSGIMQIVSASIAADINATNNIGNTLLRLSNASKNDTLQALGQLNQRLLDSTMTISRSLRNQETCTCGVESGKRNTHHGRSDSKGKHEGHGNKRRGKDTGTRGGSGKSTHTKVEYAWVRPKTRPSLSSTSSATSSRSNSSETTSSTAVVKAPKDGTRTSTERKTSSTSHKESKSVSETTDPPPRATLSQEPLSSLLPQFPSFETVQQQPTSRRTDKVTPSMYSFMSDSTKIGEIPEYKWLTPASYQAEGRYRPPAPIQPVPQIPEEAREKSSLSKRLFRNFLKPPSANPVLV